MMATNNRTEISLLIEGTQLPMAGFTPLISVGVFPRHGMDLLNVPPFIDELMVYTIQHGTDSIIYALYDRNVRPFGSMRKGSLVVCLSLPKNKQVTGYLSPYIILMEIYHTFVAINMYANPDGSHIFKEGDFDRSIFIGLLSKYRLIESGKRYVPMNCSGDSAIICIDDDEKLSHLMLDSQYSEFRMYRRVEIGRHCASTLNIEIPRRREYQIILNGIVIPQRLVKDSDSFNSADYLKDNEYNTYRGQHVSFTLQELLTGYEAHGIDNRIVIDGEIIRCEVTPKPKEFLFKAEINSSSGVVLSKEDNEKIKQWLNRGILRVVMGGKDITEAFLTGDNIIVLGADIRQQVFVSINNIEGFNFSIVKNIEKKTIILGVGKQIKSNSPVEGGSDQNLNSREQLNRHRILPTARVSQDIEICFVCPRFPDEDYSVIVSSYPKAFILRHNLHFKIYNKNDKHKRRAFLRLSEDYLGTTNLNELSLVVERCNKKGEVFQSTPITLRNETKGIVVDLTALKFRKRRRTKLFVLIGGFLVGCSFGILLCYTLFPRKVYVKESLANNEINVFDMPTEQNGHGQKDDISFVTKGSLKKEQSPLVSKDESQQMSDHISTSSVDYRSRIVECFNNRDFAALDGSQGMLEKAVKVKQITPYERNKIASIWCSVKGKKGEYTIAEKAKIKNMLSNRHFKSLDEIVRFADNLEISIKYQKNNEYKD